MQKFSGLAELALRPRSTRFRVSFTVAAVVLSFVIRFFADPFLPFGFPYLTFFPAVILTAFFAGVRAGSISAVVCGVLAWYYFIAPFHSFNLSGNTFVALAFYALIVVTDIGLIHVMHRALTRLEQERVRSDALSTANVAMFKELQHRVSNNLQVIGSMLKLQRRSVTDPTAGAALDVAVSRLNTIARIQRALHDPANQNLFFDRLLSQITPDVIDAAGMSQKVDLSLQAESLRIDADQAIPLALIYTELVSNALEHAIAGRPRMSLTITLARTADGNGAVLSVMDDGPGLPDGFTLEDSNSLGLRIARQFAVQLDGALDMTRVPTCVALTFPLAEYPDAAVLTVNDGHQIALARRPA